MHLAFSQINSKRSNLQSSHVYDMQNCKDRFECWRVGIAQTLHPIPHGVGAGAVPTILHSKNSWQIDMSGFFRVQDFGHCHCPSPMSFGVHSLFNAYYLALEQIQAVLHLVDARILSSAKLHMSS